jgi:hypothetical protein
MLVALTLDDLDRMAALVERYADLPIGVWTPQWLPLQKG